MKKLGIFLLLYAAVTTRLYAQATDCNDPHASPQANASAQQQWENGSSPVYADASELARTLNERGFLVQCLRRSVGEGFFQGQKGAARFKTERGIFEVWFLPKPETFAGLEIDEQRKNGEYVYSFGGTRKYPGRWEVQNRTTLSATKICSSSYWAMSNWQRASGTRFKNRDGSVTFVIGLNTRL
jgi:hypothetical protein